MLLQQLHRRRQQLVNNGGTTQTRVGQLVKIGRLNQGNGGSDPEDWTEFALNEFGTTPEELSFLANRRFRVVVKYEGSLSNSDLGDVQMTNAVFQDINNDQTFDFKTQIIEFTQTTNPSTVYTSGSTDLQNYINQTWQSIPFYESGETQTSADEGVFHRVSSNSLNSNTYNREIRETDSPTANTGRLNCPLQYDTIYYAESTGAGVGSVIWAQTAIRTYIPSQDTNDDYERFIISLGQDGQDCGGIDLFIYIEPETNGTLAYPEDSTAPSAPTLVGATITDQYADLTWSAVSASDLSNYIVSYRYRTNSSSSYSVIKTIRATNDTKTGVDLEDLDSYGDYEFGISAIDLNRNESSRANASVVTYSAPATVPDFDYIYWEANVGSPNTAFYVYCEFDLVNGDAPTSVTAYVTIDGTTPSSSNNVTSASLSDTSTGNDGSTWDSASSIGFSSSGVGISDVVKVIVLATNTGGTTTSPVVSLTITTLGNNNTENTAP